MQQPDAAPVPRPRVEGEREDEILDATLHLLLEVGYDRLTLDAVARRARASKATLYRRWDGKPSLVVDAMVRAKQAPHVEQHDTGSLRGDLVSTFCGQHGLGRSDATVAMGSVITALGSDPDFAARFREAFIAPKVEVSRGDLPACGRARRDLPRHRHRDRRARVGRHPPAPLLRARPRARRRHRRARHRPRHPPGGGLQRCARHPSPACPPHGLHLGSTPQKDRTS